MTSFGDRRALVARLCVLAGCLGGAAATLLPVQHAAGQVRIAMTTGGGGGSMTPIGRNAFKDYEKILTMTGEQQQSAQELFDGYRAEFKSAREAHEAKMEAAQETLQETRDFRASMKEFRKLSEEFSEKSGKLEKGFLSDLKMLLTDAQAEQWPAIERHRRRETDLRMGFFSGAAVDLIAAVARLNADPGTPEFRELLSQYEIEMDRRLQDGAKQRADELEKQGDDEASFDFAVQQERMKRLGESSKVIRDLNRDYVRRLGALMTPEHRAALEADFNRRSFPSVYDETHVEQCLKAASALPDLDTTQKETIGTLLSQYQREAASLNQAWAGAISEAEEDAGGSMNMEMRAWEKGGTGEDMKKAREARKELESRVKKRMEEVLTPAQRDRLPAKKPSEEGGGFRFRFGGPGQLEDEE